MASRRHQRRRACAGKVPYATSTRARFVITTMYLAGKIVGHVQAYRCRFCGNYHVGHAKPHE